VVRESLGEQQLHSPQHNELHAQQRQPGQHHQEQKPQDRNSERQLLVLQKAIDEARGESGHQQGGHGLGAGYQKKLQQRAGVGP
jgi:hypothetical protein